MSGPSDKYASRLACILILFHPPPPPPPPQGQLHCLSPPMAGVIQGCQGILSVFFFMTKPSIPPPAISYLTPPPYALYTFYQCQPAAIRTQSEMVNTIINKNKHFIPFPWGTQGRPTTTTVKPKQQQLVVLRAIVFMLAGTGLSRPASFLALINILVKIIDGS